MGATVTSKAIFEWLVSRGQLYVGLVLRNVTSDPIEFDAPWYERQPVAQGSLNMDFQVPSSVDESFMVYGIGLYDTPEKGTGNLLLYHDGGGRGFYLDGGHSLTLTIDPE